MRAGFMSSVCPRQTLPELIATAGRYKYEGIEFRVEWHHAHGIELTSPRQELATARRMLADHGLTASCIATSAKFNSADLAEHKRQLEVLRQYIALAADVGAPCVRTFADPLPEEDSTARQAIIELAAASYASIDDWAAAHSVYVLIETHTNMRAHWAKEILDCAQARQLGALWHIGHHLQRGQSVEEAYTYLRPYVRHVHFTAMVDDSWVHDTDNQRMFDLLAADRFPGFLSVEVINPDDPEAVLAQHRMQYLNFLEGTRAS